MGCRARIPDRPSRLVFCPSIAEARQSYGYSLWAVEVEPLDSSAVGIRRRLLRRDSYLARAVYGCGRCQGMLVRNTLFSGAGGDAVTPHVAAASQWHARAEGPAAAAISRWRGQWTDEQSREPWKHRLQHLRRVVLGESRDRGCCIYVSVTQKGKCGVGD